MQFSIIKEGIEYGIKSLKINNGYIVIIYY